MSTVKPPFPSKPLAFGLTLVENWHRTVSEYLEIIDLRIDEQHSLLRATRAAEIVMEALELKRTIGFKTEANAYFLAAVASADTHANVIGNVSVLYPAPSIITNEIATLLRYAH